jgi:hypothetical protein
MAADGKKNLDILESSEGNPIILIGEAKSLQGELRVRNLGTDRIQAAEPASLRLQFASAAKPLHFAQIILPSGLEPGQVQRVKLSLEFDPQTTPGEYKGEVDVAGQTHPVIVYVTEIVHLAISPQVLVFDQPGDSLVEKQIILRNEGNVPLTIDPIGQVALGEELMLRRTLSLTVAAAGERRSRSLGKLVAELVNEEAKAVLGESVYINVKNPGILLQPGEVRPLRLEIKLPEKLTVHARYIGRIPIYTSDLQFIVVPPAGNLNTSD